MLRSIRTRLTLWYAMVLALSLVAFATIVYYAAARVFYERQEESLRSTAQTVASAYMEEIEEEQSVAKANEVVLAQMVFPNRYVEVTDTTGRILAWSGNLSGNLLTIPAQTLIDARQHKHSSVVINGMRVSVVPLSPTKEVGYAAVAEPLSVIDEGLHRLRGYFLGGVPVILLLASVGGYFLARKSLLPISSMNRQTQRVTAERLSSRLDVATRDEVGALASTINDLLARLEASFNEQQRFIVDASHELRTPLAVLRGETEVALSQPREIDEYQESLALIKDEAERLSRIVEDLFLLARQPIDKPARLIKEPIALDELIGECVRAAEVLAARKNLRLNWEDESTSVTVTGDAELLKRMLLNLLDNAVKYTPEGGAVLVKLTALDGKARVTISDNGIGIPESDQSKIFDRFYRVDKARSRAFGGAGLGLSIARWIVETHAGTISVESVSGKGSSFIVELPLQRESRQ